MSKKQFEKLKEKIEIKMFELARLQKKFHYETGQDHVMPFYISIPKHLERFKK